MTGDKRREEKKKIIYEATLSLLQDHNDFHRFKVEDIAKKADVGKGTIYEYFSHKEQVISESIFYMIKEWITQLEKAFNKQASFEKGFRLLLEDVYEIMEKKHQMIFTFLTLQDFPKNSIEEIEESMIRRKIAMQKLTFHLYQRIVEAAYKDGVIQKQPDAYDGYFAVNSAMMYVMIYEGQRNCSEDLLEASKYTKEEIVEKAYKVFINLLK